jgi:hypothetical protein
MPAWMTPDNLSLIAILRHSASASFFDPRFEEFAQNSSKSGSGLGDNFGDVIAKGSLPSPVLIFFEEEDGEGREGMGWEVELSS